MSNDLNPIDYMQAQVTQPVVRTHTHNLPVEGVKLKPLRKPDSVVAMEARIAELESALREMIGNCFWCDGCGAIWQNELVPCPRCKDARSVLGK